MSQDQGPFLCPPLMAGLGLGERPGAFKIKYDLRQMDVER